MPSKSRSRAKRGAGNALIAERDEMEIPEEEQWRIVNDTGILNKIPTAQDTPDLEHEPNPERPDDELFQCLVYLIPFSSLYALMDILVHQQYRQELTFTGEIRRLIEAVPILAFFIFYTNRHKAGRWAQAFLALLTCASGTRLFWVVNKGTWKHVMRQAAPLSTIWIYGIVRLDLLHAVGTLFVIAAYVKANGFKITF